MTIAAAKEKLHDIIDHADEAKIFALLSLFEKENEQSGHVYDEATLNMLRERSREYLSGESIIYTLEESMERVKQSRAKNGV